MNGWPNIMFYGVENGLNQTECPQVVLYYSSLCHCHEMFDKVTYEVKGSLFIFLWRFKVQDQMVSLAWPLIRVAYGPHHGGNICRSK
jgi:hypothetical protein